MSSSPFSPAFDSLVGKSLERWHIPGVSFSVVLGENTWSKGYGYAQQSPRKAVEPSTLFYVASTTKAHLCAAWAIYIASSANTGKPKDQQISFSTPLAEIIREDFVLADPVRTTQLTIEDACSHRTGLPPHELSYGFGDTTTVKGVTRSLRHLPPHNELRAEFEYCNTPFIAASYALEMVTGKPLGQYMREVLWAPLGMKHTYAGYDEASKAIEKGGRIIAKGSTWSRLPTDTHDAAGHLVEEKYYMNLSGVSGAGYVISTAEDYTKWMRCWLRPASGPLAQTMIQELWTPRTIIPPDGKDNAPFNGVSTYGLGWFISNYQAHKLYWHPGSLIGAGSLILLVPDIDWGLTLHTNGHDGSAKLEGLAMEVLDHALGIPEAERTALRRTDDALLDDYREMVHTYTTARSRLYPTAPATPNIPLPVRTEEYAGTYRNVTYGPLNFTASLSNKDIGDRLVCGMRDRTWESLLVLEHVNAQYWLATITRARSPLKTALRAESRLGVDGRVEAIGVAMEPSLPDEIFWFDKVYS
ncbi:hypothetical protein LTR08_009292 [Meristemomyces frigidus]|nr:hypothetical protein LTR08_009292 [Meristemomyces frigidus]